MLSYQQVEGARQRSYVQDNFHIQEHEAVRTISRQQLLGNQDLQSLQYRPIVSDELFPSTYYAGNYIAPEKVGPFPLSPRQEEAIVRQKPLVTPREVPIIHKAVSPRPQVGSETTAFRPSEPSQRLVPTPQMAASPKPHIPQDYANMVVAKPNKDVKYGDYPELKSSAMINFGTDLSKSQQNLRNLPNEKKITATVNVNNAPEIYGMPPAPEGYVWQYAEQPTSPPPTSPQPQQEQAEEPTAVMETKVSGAQPKRVGKWTLAQLRQTDGIIPSQAGWNKGDSQKLMTNFGTPRNTALRIKSENLQEVPEDVALKSHGEVRLQSGTNKFASQRGMVNFGTGRDVCREGVRNEILPGDLEPLPEEKIRLSDGIVRLQSGTNKYASQKQMTSFGTNRRETTKMVDTKHPEYDHEKPDQSEIPLQSGTNKFASQKGMTSFGTNRRETTKMLDTAHPEYDHTASIDQTQIPYQMGSNKYASQKGMTSFGQPRWEVLDPSISWQNRKSQGMVRLQSGTNRFASQAGWWGSSGFGTPRNNTYEAEGGELPYEDMKKSESIIPSQAGWNKGDSQKLMTSFGTPRDVRGKHLKRLWELEYPEEAEIPLDRL